MLPKLRDLCQTKKVLWSTFYSCSVSCHLLSYVRAKWIIVDFSPYTALFYGAPKRTWQKNIWWYQIFSCSRYFLVLMRLSHAHKIFSCSRDFPVLTRSSKQDNWAMTMIAQSINQPFNEGLSTMPAETWSMFNSRFSHPFTSLPCLIPVYYDLYGSFHAKRSLVCPLCSCFWNESFKHQQVFIYFQTLSKLTSLIKNYFFK